MSDIDITREIIKNIEKIDFDKNYGATIQMPYSMPIGVDHRDKYSEQCSVNPIDVMAISKNSKK